MNAVIKPHHSTCAELRLRIRSPKIKSKADRFLQGKRHWQSQPALQRRLWVMITFGFDLEMLLLHMMTLSDVADGFIVSEARSTFMLHDKPAMLSDLRTGGNLSQELAAKTHVVVVDLQAAAISGHCSRRAAGREFTRCLEDWQRYALLRRLFELASRDDVAVLADSDEISSPDALQLITRCFPFPAAEADLGSRTSPSDLAALGKLVLSASHYHYGMHCFVDDRVSKQPWEYGPHAYAVSALATAFNGSRLLAASGGPVAESESDAAGFAAGRSQNRYSAPWVDRAAWHLSSFGRPEHIMAKFSQWGHSNM